MELQQKRQYITINEGEYADVFSTFIAKSTEYDTMLQLIKSCIDNLDGRAVKVLSVGAGTGCMEDDLIHKFGLNMDYFYAIEPNSSHQTELEKTISRWGLKNKIDTRYFDPETKIDDSFDLILMSHCMYCMTDPLGAMLHAMSLLKPGGRVIIFNQSDKGGYELYSRFITNASLNRRPINDHAISCNELSAMLNRSGIHHETKQGSSTLEVDDFLRRRNTPTANDVITFFLQTRFENLSEDMKLDIFDMTLERSFENSDGKYVFKHPTAMIQIFNGEHKANTEK